MTPVEFDVFICESVTSILIRIRLNKITKVVAKLKEGIYRQSPVKTPDIKTSKIRFY